MITMCEFLSVRIDRLFRNFDGSFHDIRRRGEGCVADRLRLGSGFRIELDVQLSGLTDEFRVLNELIEGGPQRFDPRGRNASGQDERAPDRGASAEKLDDLLVPGIGSE